MANYKSLYFQLFNEITDTIERLKHAQQQTEQEVINSEEQLHLEPPLNVKEPNKVILEDELEPQQEKM
ncbi:MAG: hypothetical protein PHG02_00110 [Oscillospiraceae bacterium]|nr:hypothetical protein [Oscillospiraceae bacterium]